MSKEIERKPCKLRKGDEVVVIAGKSKGEKGNIDKFDRKNDRVFVSGVNLVKRAQKPSELNPNGGIIEKPASIHISNVAIIDPKSKKPARIGYRMEDNKKVRFAKSSGSVI